MPIYEYRCQSCGHEFEEMILGKEPEPDTCPACGEKQVGRAMSAPAFQLKGTGWYVTDYKTKEGAPSTSTADESAPVKEADPVSAPAEPAPTPASSDADS